MSPTKPVPTYENHAGTVLVSGKTDKHSIGKNVRYAMHLLKQGVSNVELVFLGAHAGQRTYIISSIICETAWNELGIHVGFRPMWFKGTAVDQDLLGNPKIDPATGQVLHKEVDLYAWRIFDATESWRQHEERCEKVLASPVAGGNVSTSQACGEEPHG